MTTPIPPARQWVIIGTLAGCLLIGGGIVYWLIFGGGPASRTIDVDPNAPTKTTVRRFNIPQMAGVTRHGNDDWSVRGQTGAVRVKRGGDGKFDFDYWFLSGFDPATEKVQLISNANRATKDDAMAAEWGISPQQQGELRAALSQVAAPTLSQADRDALAQAFGEYLKATTPAARGEPQRKLTQKVDEIVKGKVQPAHDAIDKKVAEIRRILKGESIDKMMKK